MKSPLALLPLAPLAPLALTLAGCGSAMSNYGVEYKAVGAANETAARNSEAERAFKEAAVTDDAKRAIAAVKVYMDSIPPEVTVRDGVISAAEASGAKLIGSVEVTALWKAPSNDAEVIPALQKAAAAMKADVAFCPRDKARNAAYQCYLVQKAGAAR